MFSVAVWLELGPSFWSDAKTSPASVVLGSCRGRKNVSMTLKIWRFVIWTTEWKLSRWYSLWSSNYATPFLPFPESPPQNPNPLLLFLSRNEAVKLLCPLWIIFGVGVMALCPAALRLPCSPLIPPSWLHSSVSHSHANLRCKDSRDSSLVAAFRCDAVWRYWGVHNFSSMVGQHLLVKHIIQYVLGSLHVQQLDSDK